MKTIKQTMKALALGAVVVCGFAALAEEETPPQTAWTYTGGVLTSSDGWKFTITDAGDGGVSLASRSAIGTDMCLNLRTAETVIGKPITVFGKYVFSNPTGGGTAIQKVWLPLGLKRLNEGAFWKCTKLTNVYPFLPETVEFIGTYVFMEDGALAGDLVLSNPNLNMEQHVGGGQHGLGNAAFAKCDAITSVDLSQTRLKYSGDFYWCTGLKSVKLPETLETLGYRAFGWCTALTNVVPLLPASVKSIGADAFAACGNLKCDLVLSNPALKLDGIAVFYESGITSADLSATATESLCGFNACKSLKWVKLPHGLKTIANEALRDCSVLTNVTPLLPKTLTYLGSKAFAYSPIQGDLVLPKGATMPVGGDYHNPEMPGVRLTSADFSQSALTEIPMAFYDNYYLQRVIYPPTATKFHADYTHWSTGQSALRDIRFMSWPSNFKSMAGTFGGTPSDGRIVYPKGDADWEAYVQELKGAGNFTPWDPESDAAKSYLTRFADTPWKPIGSAVIHKGATYGNTRKWLVPHTYASGLMVLVM